MKALTYIFHILFFFTTHLQKIWRNFMTRNTWKVFQWFVDAILIKFFQQPCFWRLVHKKSYDNNLSSQAKTFMIMKKKVSLFFFFFTMNFSWATERESPSPILGNHSITIGDEVVVHKIIQLPAVMLWKHSDCFLKPIFVHSKGNQTHNVNWHWYCIFICESYLKENQKIEKVLLFKKWFVDT